MKNKIIVSVLMLSLILGVVVIFIMFPKYREKKTWEYVLKQDTIKEYSKYIDFSNNKINLRKAYLKREKLILDSIKLYPNNFLLYNLFYELKSDSSTYVEMVSKLLYTHSIEVDSFHWFKLYADNNGGFQKDLELLKRSDELYWNECTSEKNWKKYLAIFPYGIYKNDALFNIESEYWKKLHTLNNMESYKSYLSKYPNGIYLNDAKYQFDELLWKESLKSNTLNGYLFYIKNYLKGQYFDKARLNYDELLWNNVSKENTIQSYTKYLNDSLGLRNKSKAKKGIERIEWGKIKNNSSSVLLEEFLNKYPNSFYKSQALSSLIFFYLNAITENPCILSNSKYDDKFIPDHYFLNSKWDIHLGLSYRTFQFLPQNRMIYTYTLIRDKSYEGRWVVDGDFLYAYYNKGSCNKMIMHITRHSNTSMTLNYYPKMNGNLKFERK